MLDLKKSPACWLLGRWGWSAARRWGLTHTTPFAYTLIASSGSDWETYREVSPPGVLEVSLANIVPIHCLRRKTPLSSPAPRTYPQLPRTESRRQTVSGRQTGFRTACLCVQFPEHFSLENCAVSEVLK